MATLFTRQLGTQNEVSFTSEFLRVPSLPPSTLLQDLEKWEVFQFFSSVPVFSNDWSFILWCLLSVCREACCVCEHQDSWVWRAQSYGSRQWLSWLGPGGFENVWQHMGITSFQNTVVWEPDWKPSVLSNTVEDESAQISEGNKSEHLLLLGLSLKYLGSWRWCASGWRSEKITWVRDEPR